MSTVRYKALGPLLSGEGSRAFLGLMLPEKSPAQPVVLIWVPADVSRDPEQSGQLAKETLRASILEHPNIIRVYGLASLDEGLARVVEFADGETLRKVLDSAGKFPPLLAAKIAADAAMGLHYAHLAGNDDGTPLLHGDLRPETLMVSFSGAVKVAGYGALSVAPREQGGKRVVFRRRYCAPEQIVGTRDAITVQTDVYLLGLLLYECLTGKMPWHDEESFDQAVLTAPLPLDSEDIPPPLAKVIEKATAKRAQERYRTPREMREAIEAAIGEIPGNAAMAAHLERFFPADDSVRAERRALIDHAMAEAGVAPPAKAVAQTPETRPDPRPEPRPAPASSPASLPPAPEPAPTSAKPAAPLPPPSAPTRPAAPPAAPAKSLSPAPPAPSPRVSAADAPPARSGGTERKVVIISSVAAMLAIALLWVASAWLHVSAQAEKIAPTTSSATAPIAPSQPTPVVDTAPKPLAPAPKQAPAPLSPAPKKTVAAVPAHFRRPRRAQLPTLELAVTPPVNARLDGKSLGRTPLTVHVRAGAHRLSLVDHAEGVDVERSVEVDRDGTDLHIALQRAFVSLDVPNGAKVFVDGQLIAHASVKDHLIYEGHHHVRVTLGMAEWNQSFDVGPQEHMSFNVSRITE